MRAAIARSLRGAMRLIADGVVRSTGSAGSGPRYFFG
jgi:hypothetical protein